MPSVYETTKQALLFVMDVYNYSNSAGMNYAAAAKDMNIIERKYIHTLY